MRFVLLVAGAALCGCDSSQPVPTATENAQLDDAANMLDRAPDKLANADSAQLPPANSDADPE